MIEVFLELLEEAHNNGKRSDTGFKPEAWVGFRAGIQAVYQGDEHTTTGKIRSKLDYISILGWFFGSKLTALIGNNVGRVGNG